MKRPLLTETNILKCDAMSASFEKTPGYLKILESLQFVNFHRVLFMGKGIFWYFSLYFELHPQAKHEMHC